MLDKQGFGHVFMVPDCLFAALVLAGNVASASASGWRWEKTSGKRTKTKSDPRILSQALDTPYPRIVDSLALIHTVT